MRSSEKTFVLFYPGCIEFEVMLACELLNRKYPVEVVTPDGKDHLGSNGMTVRASLSLDQVNPSHYRVALFPGGDPAALIGNARLNQVIQEMHRQQSVLGAICAGPLILDQAGILSGRRIAHGYKRSQWDWLRERGHFIDTELTDKVLVIDKNIVTARPDAYIDFSVEIAVLSGALDSSKKEFVKRYNRGLSTKLFDD